MSDFVKALEAADLAPGKGTEVSVAGQPVALFNVDGTFFAISNTCLHRGGPLGQGYVEGRTVTCPWHAWTFDVASGENVVNGELKVACFATKVEDGQVFVRVA
jgi:nitrite reductase (NADH) small subunit/3-phenylpropionate/trans-cinnamate dioxygenase ferredoxin subunit